MDNNEPSHRRIYSHQPKHFPTEPNLPSFTTEQEQEQEQNNNYNSNYNHVHNPRPIPKIIIKKIKLKPINIRAKKEKIFNKLYGISDKMIKQYEKLKKDTHSTWEEHQEKWLKISTNLRKENLVKLSQDFRKIKMQSHWTEPLPILENLHSSLSKPKLIDHTVPLPKINKSRNINININITDSATETGRSKTKTQNNRTKVRSKIATLPPQSLTINTDLNKKKNVLKYYKIWKNNLVLMKMFEILPEHIVEWFARNKG